MTRLATLTSAIERRLGAQQALRNQLAAAEVASEEAMMRALVRDEGVDWLAAIYETHRAGFEEQIGEVVSKGLTDVFADELLLFATLGQSGDMPTLRFTLADRQGEADCTGDKQHGDWRAVRAHKRSCDDCGATQYEFASGWAFGVETDVMDARSGGYINLIAFLLQARVLLAARPPLARVMVLDECFSNIHESLYPTVAALLDAMVKDGGFQLIIITQNQRLADALAEIGEVTIYTKADGQTMLTKATDSQVVPATLKAAG